MITATGNNFGAGEITFKASDKKQYLILNGRITVDKTAPQYASASVLEIYVPDLNLERSLETYVYATRHVNGGSVMTVVKSWIKDRNTICVEKKDGLTDEDEYELMFCCMYVTKGKDSTFEAYPEVIIQIPGYSDQGYLAFRKVVITDDYVYLCIRINHISTNPADAPIEIPVTGLPEGFTGDFPILKMEYMINYYGNKYSYVHIEDGTMTIQGFVSYYGTDTCQCLIYAYLVR